MMEELRSGSEAAFDWLVTYYHAPVYGVIFGILRDPNDAADVTQEVFLKAFRGIRRFREGSSLKTWLYRIAVRESLNYKRWFWRHLRFQTSIDEEQDGATIELEDSGCSPFEELAAREIQHVVQHALGRGRPRLPRRRDSPRFGGALLRRSGRGSGRFRGYREVPDFARPPHAARNSRTCPGSA